MSQSEDPSTTRSPSLFSTSSEDAPEPQVASASPARFAAWMLLVIVCILLGVLLVRYLLYVSALLAYPYEWDEDEGLAIHFARRLWLRQPIYVSINHLPMLSACYPPVYHLLLAPLVHVLGPVLLAGRLLSLAATAAFCASSAALVRIETRQWGLAALSVILILGSPAVSIWSPLARIDSLALGLAITGLLLLRQSRWPLAGATAGIALLLLATFTRYQSVLLLPAGLWCLWRRSRRSALLAAMGLAVAGGTALMLLNRATSGQFWTSTVSVQAAGFDPARLGERVSWFLTRHPLLVVGMVAWFALSVRRRNPDLWTVLALTVIPLQLLLGKVGASINYHMPAVVIGVVCMLLSAHALLSLRPERWLSAAGCVVLALISGQAILYRIDPVPTPSRQDRETNDALVGVLQRAPGPVLTDRRLMLAMLAGHEPQIDICTLHFAYGIGRPGGASDAQKPAGAVCWDPTELLAAVSDSRYGLVLVEEPPLFPAEVVTAIREKYRRLNAEPIVIGNWHGANRYHLGVPAAPRLACQQVTSAGRDLEQLAVSHPVMHVVEKPAMSVAGG